MSAAARTAARLAIVATPARSAELRRLLDDAPPDVVAEGEGCVLVAHEPPAVDALAALAGLDGAPAVVVVNGEDPALRRALLRAGAAEVLDGRSLGAAALGAAVGDAAARGAASARLRESDERYRALLGSVDDGFCIVEVTFDETSGRCVDYLVLEVNAAFARQRGRDAALGRRARELSPPVDEFWYELFGRVARTGEPCRLERHDAATGRWFEVQAMPVGAPERRRVAMLFRDVTARKRTELELRRSEELVRTIAENSTQGFAMMDERGYCTYANRAWLEMTGYSREEISSAPLHDLVHHHRPDGRPYPKSECPIDRALPENFDVRSHEDLFFRKDGSAFPVLCAASPIFKEGTAVSTVIEIRDVTAAKRAEVELREREQRAREAAARAEAERRVLDAILAAAPAGIIVADAGGRLLRMNPANQLLWGPAPYSRGAEEYGAWKGWWADQSERHGRRVEPGEWAMARALRGETVRDDVVEIEPFDRPGVRRTIVNSGAPVRDAEGRVTGAVVAQMDITALVAAEGALRESEARLRDLADNIAQLAWMTDETGFIFWYNRRWFEYTGTTLERMKGWGWRAVHHPDHAARVEAKFRAHLASGEPWEDTFPLRGRDGRYRWFLSRAFPLRDDSGRVVNWFGTNTDVTAQRDAEEALREADRRKDEFIATLAHELRNPLAPVRSAVEVLRRLGPAEPRLVRARDVIDRQVTHMARLVDDLLDVSRVARGLLALRKETCDLGAVARQTAEDYRPSLEAAGLAFTVDVPAPPAWVEGDPVRLAQMIGNLLHNASRFTERGGRVALRVAVDAAARAAVVSVADTGVGIEPELLARLFGSFHQGEQGLARSKGGLGLGLALTRGLAELHGGEVVARSEGAGRGSTFELRIPLSGPGPEASAPAREASGGAALRVLVVEDNPDAAEMLGAMLSLNGHEVRLAFDGESGVAAAREFGPDVVVSDIGLPGELDGYGVARALRADPALSAVRLVALSGYADEGARRRSREAGFDLHLAKPADVEALERALAGAGRRG